MTDLLLTALLNYGAPLLGGILFLAALGIPLPATLLLLAAGAFARQGMLGLDGAVVAAVIGAVVGDSCSYLLGRHGAGLLPSRWRRGATQARVSELFARWGGWCVFLTRFLFTPIALPVNLLAGSSRYPWSRYLAAVVPGEVIWVLGFGGMGYFLASEWELVGQLASDLIGMLVGALLIAVGLAVFWLRLRRRSVP